MKTRPSQRSIGAYPAFARNPVAPTSAMEYSVRLEPAMLLVLPQLNTRAISILSFALRNMHHYNGFVQLRREDILTQYPSLAGDSYYAGLSDLLKYQVLRRKLNRHNIFFVNTEFIKRITTQTYVPTSHAAQSDCLGEHAPEGTL